MAVLAGNDGAVKVGATSNAAVTFVNSWTITYSGDEYTQKSLGVDYTRRIIGHTDWTATLDIDLDETDAQQTALRTPGTAVTVWLYTDDTTPDGYTGTGVTTSEGITVGAQKNNLSITIGGNGALSLIS